MDVATSSIPALCHVIDPWPCAQVCRRPCRGRRHTSNFFLYYLLFPVFFHNINVPYLNKKHTPMVYRLPPHGRRCRRVTEGGNDRHGGNLVRGGIMRVGSSWRESSGWLGPDRVQGCCYGLTYRNQVEDSTGQSPSDESQRARSTCQLGFGVAFRV